MSDYPEHDKLSKIQEQTQAIGEFLEWLTSQGIHLMRWREDLTDNRLTDPQCAKAVRGSDAPCAPVRPEGDSYGPDGTIWWRQHCLHWQEPDEDGEYGECCRCGRGHFYEVHGIRAWEADPRNIQSLLAAWAGIDLNKIEAEKRAMLASLRAS
jgi:hypothetical protein